MDNGLPSETELQLLALVVEERSGGEIATLYRKEVGRSISYGTLYPTMRRLKDAGWVTARDDQDEDGRIRYFRISGAGVRALRRACAHHQQVAALGLAHLRRA